MKLTWDQIGEKFYETGLDRGVLYEYKNGAYTNGVAWNGLITATESPSGAEPNDFYADNIKYLSIRSAEDFGGTIECYTYPDEWNKCNGESEMIPGVMLAQQTRDMFGLCFRTKIGNDVKNNDYGYKLHFWYGCTASPSERAYESVNDSPSPITFSYEVSSIPVQTTVPTADGGIFKPVSSITIDSTKVDKDKLAALETILYGADPTESDSSGTGTAPRLPLPDELATLLAQG